MEILEEIYGLSTEDLTTEIPHQCLICGREIDRDANYCDEPDCDSGIEIQEGEAF